MKKPGFTLIELIVSVGIIALVTGIFLANYSSANRRSDLTMTAQKMVADIRLAQNYGLGLSRYGLSGSTDVPLGGWGVHFDLANYGNARYLIFADDNGDGAYNSGDEDNLTYGAQISTLPNNIIIQSLAVGTATGGGIGFSDETEADITFLPPDPITTINSSNNYNLDPEFNKQIDIILKDVSTGNTKTVRVNYLGLAEVVN